MSRFQFTEKTKRTWAFAITTALWVGATFAIVWHLAPKADTNTAASRASLERNNSLIEEQAILLENYRALSKEIKNTHFQVYQMYVVSELRDKAKGIHQKNTAIDAHSRRVSQILELLLNAREELVAKQRNLVKIGDQVQNCREGNQDIQLN